MKTPPKFKEGDRIIFPTHRDLGAGTVLRVRYNVYREENAYDLKLDRYPSRSDWDFEDVLEFEDIFLSPLYQALK
jgi:hypothetical protein